MEKLIPLLKEGFIVIAGSGTGITPEGKLTRLNTPHLTGGLLAASSGAASLWYLTHQDGILTADPELVPSARTVPVIPMDTLGDLADFGLPVPSKAAVAPAAAAHIPTFIRNLANPTHPGTYIQPRADDGTETLPVIVARRNIRWLRVSASAMDTEAGITALLAEGIHALAGHGAEHDVNFFMNASQMNIARLALAQAYSSASIQADSGHSALIILIGMDTDTVTYLARHLHIPAQTLTLQGRTAAYPALVLLDENIEVIVEKIHNLTLSQLK